MATARQRKVASLLAKNKGSVSKSMREAGYGAETSRKPSVVTKSKAWPELMEEFIPESLVAETHRGLLKASKMQVVDKTATYEPDNDARARGVDLAYKLRGRYAGEKVELTTRQYEDLDNKGLADKIAALRKVLSKE